MSRRRANPEDDAERRITAALVDDVVPALIDSLVLSGSVNDLDATTVLASARRMLVQLLIHLAAGERSGISPSLRRRGAVLLQQCRQSRTGRGKPAESSNVAQLQSWLATAAKPWKRLAPWHAAAPAIPAEPRWRRRSRQARLPTNVDASNRRLAEALRLLFGALGEEAAASTSDRSDGALLRFSPRLLGCVYEQLLGRRLRLTADGSRLIAEKTSRRQQGSFYTPALLVRQLIEQTVGPALQTRLKKRSPWPLTVIDPAMGSGHFLTAAYDYLVERLTDIGASRRSAAVLSMLYGIDLDVETVELARISLWLHSGQSLQNLPPLEQRLVAGDALLEPIEQLTGQTSFDAVIGNPPYGPPSSESYRRRLRAARPQAKQNADLAAVFVGRALEIVAPEGRVGFVLPKPLTYSYAWRHIRRQLRRRVCWVRDVGRSWNEVLLEQILLAYQPLPSRRQGYAVASPTEANGRALPNLAWAWAERFDVLLSALDHGDFERLRRFQFSTDSVGSLCRTFRGLPWQRKLSAIGNRSVVGGRNLERWRVRSTAGHISVQERAFEGGALPANWDAFARPKLLFQNIVAHVERPEPHLRLIGTYDAERQITLDTVNNLVPRHDGIDLHAVLALLHSEPVNWLVYRVVYNQAIRTMHFDQYFLDKIPLPAGWKQAAPRLAALARQAIEKPDTQAACEAEIDRLVRRAYGDDG